MTAILTLLTLVAVAAPAIAQDRSQELRRLEERKVRPLERANDVEERKARAVEDLRLRR